MKKLAVEPKVTQKNEEKSSEERTMAARQANSPTPPPASSRSRARTRIGPWPLADGYLWLQTLGGFLRGLTWFAGLFLAFAVVSGAQRMAKDHLPIPLVLQFIALQLPRIVLFTIPASLLFGVVQTFNEMSSKGEVTALAAGGMSLTRMLRAPLTLGVLLAVFAYWLQEVVVPGAEFQKGNIAASVLKSAKASQIFPIIDKRPDGTIERIVQVKDFDIEHKVLYEPLIQINRQDGSTELEIAAHEARWDNKTKSWLFFDGKTRASTSLWGKNQPANQTASVSTPFQQLSLKTDVAPDPNILQKTQRDLEGELKDHNFEMASRQEIVDYRAQQEKLLLDLDHTKAPPDDLKKNIEGEIRAATFGIHDKIATPLVVIALILIGAPLGVRPQRTASPGLAMGLSIMVLLLYYLGWTLGSFWGKAGLPQPVIAAYAPFLVITCIGTVLVWKKN